MKLKSIAFLTAFFLLSTLASAQKAEMEKSAPAKLPSVKEVLEKYVDAIGGRAANEKITSRFTKGTVELSPMGLKGTFETYAAPQDRTISKLNLAGIGELIDGFDGTTAWAVNPIQGSREKSGAELVQARLINNFYREINHDKLYSKMEVKGIEKVGDTEAYAVIAEAKDLAPETLYFDTKSGLLLRSDTTMISPEGNQSAKIYYEDMREADGVKIPFRVRTVLPQFVITLAVTELKHNLTMKPETFTKPKQ